MAFGLNSMAHRFSRLAVCPAAKQALHCLQRPLVLRVGKRIRLSGSGVGRIVDVCLRVLEDRGRDASGVVSWPGRIPALPKSAAVGVVAGYGWGGVAEEAAVCCRSRRRRRRRGLGELAEAIDAVGVPRINVHGPGIIRGLEFTPLRHHLHTTRQETLEMRGDVRQPFSPALEAPLTEAAWTLDRTQCEMPVRFPNGIA